MKGIETPWRQLLLTTLTLLLSMVSFASHIVGGEISYQCLGNDYYQITLRYYRDCSGVVMAPTADIKIADPSGTVLQTFTVAKGPSTFLNVNQSGCGKPTPSICIETATYVADSVYLPGGPSYYVIYNQQCCRSNSVTNITNAWQVGATFPAYLYPSSSVVCNTSPDFGAYPPVAVPLNVPVNIPISANDPDGDSLFFQLCSPLSNATAISPFSTVPFAPGYSSANMVNANPALSINPYTGVLTGTPTQIGKYAIGICVNEYRNGVLVGRARRDYQFTVIPPWALFATITSQTDAGCGSPGTATVSAAGTTGPFTYNWSSGATTATANNLSAGTHTVVVSDGTCTDTATVQIGGGASFTTTVTNQSTLPCGTTTGASATISITGGVSPYTVVWPSGPGGMTNNQLSLGVNSIIISDATSCTDTLQINIAQAGSGVSLNVDSINAVACATASNGYASLSVNSGTAPYSYLWSDLSTLATRSNLLPGNYGVRVTDANGCLDSISLNIPIGAGMSLSWDSIQTISCAGGNDGYLQPEVTGGVAPYSFLWSNASTASSLSGLSAGHYVLTVTDAAGCTENIYYDLLDPDTLNVDLIHIADPGCYNAFDGAIQVSVSGGTAPYSILWNTTDTSSTLNNLPAGNYGLTVTDSRGCSILTNYSLSNPDSLWLSLKTSQSNLCNGGSNAMLEVEAHGGTKPYSYSWSNGATTPQIQNLTAGTYTVLVADSSGCTKSAQFTISDPPMLSIQIDTVMPASCGLNNGIAIVSVNGGVAPYTVHWSNNSVGLQVTALAAGAYQAYVTDANGCSDSVLVQVQSLSLFSASLDSLISPSCFGMNNGFAKVLPQGGQAPYTYYWSNGSTADTANGLLAGNYYVLAEDALGCTDSVHFVLSSPNQLQVSVDTLQNPLCFGSHDGKLSIDISGGNAPYNILWSTTDTVSTLNNLGSGSYGVTVTDSRGCSSTASFTLTNPDSLQIILKNQQNVSCNGAADGAIDVSVKGGVSPYLLNWSSNHQDSSIAGLQAGSYTLNVLDANGCAGQATYIINEPQVLSVVLDSVNSETCSQQNGSAAISVTGGTAPYTILWNTNQTTNYIRGLAAGTYNASVTDANNCTDSIQVFVSGAGNFSLSIDSTRAPLCAGSNTGFAKVAVTGGTAPYSYSWSNGSMADTAHGLTGGFNYVLVSDALGCSDSLIVNLPKADSLFVELQSINHALCYGLTGNIAIQAKGGKAPYLINWNNGAVTQNLTNVKAGTYSVNVVDANGCYTSASYTITEPDSFIVVVDSIKNPTCPGENDGEVFLKAMGNGNISSIVVSQGKVSPGGVSDLAAGKYSVYVLDSAGCGTNVEFEIKDPEPLVVQDVNVVPPGCAPGDLGFIELLVEGGVPPYSYVWQDGPNTLNRYSVSSGFYQLTVTDAGGCATTRTFDFLTKDIRLFINIRELSCVSYADAEVEVSVSGAAKPFRLMLNGDEVYEGKINLQSNDYILTLTDAEGCSITEEFVIDEQKELKLFLANAFTPDGDGVNDLYAINGSKECFTNATLEVFNRWGAKVYETQNPFIDFWDGTINGNELKSDVYLYHFKSDQLTKSGYFNIIR